MDDTKTTFLCRMENPAKGRPTFKVSPGFQQVGDLRGNLEIAEMECAYWKGRKTYQQRKQGDSCPVGVFVPLTWGNNDRS